MAALRKKGFTLQFSEIIICLSLIVSHVSCIRTEQKMYIDLKTQSACIRNLNATHQAGCTSAEKGNVGTVHYVQSKSDLDWIYFKGPHSPYIVILNAHDFTGELVKNLSKSHRVNGIMVINVFKNETSTPYPQDGFSSVDPCPNDPYGLYANNQTYQGCKRLVWNPAGTSLHHQDLGIPIFALSDPTDVDAVLNKCYFPFNEPINNEARDYPVCSAELKARMDGAVNAVVCMRRTKRIAFSLSGPQGFCDPLGDKNIVTFMKNISSKSDRAPKSVIMVGTKLDSTSLFQNEYNAADTTVMGVVTLLATAEALWKLRDELNHQNAKDILFAFFQGETYDYIGSSRVVYDMQEGVFPQDTSKDSSAEYVSKMNLTHIDHIVELNQVGRRDKDGALWAHFDPSLPEVFKKSKEMAMTLNNFSTPLFVPIKAASGSLPLPPASAQRFLLAQKDIPVVLLTDHEDKYTNKYYNSRFDTVDKLEGFDYPADANDTIKYNFITTQASLIANFSSALARYLYSAASGSDKIDDKLQNLTADPLTVTRLLYCFLISPNCELFYESVDNDDVQSLKDAKQPFGFYVSVDGHTKEVTQLVNSLMARFTGHKIPTSQDNCKGLDQDKRFNYFWMQGALKTVHDDEREGWCYKAIVHYTKALSPAFSIEDYDFTSGKYSSWTESRWGTTAIGVRLFLLPSEQFQASILAVGVLTLVISLVIVYFCQKFSSTIFNVHSVRTSRDYSPMS